MPRFILALIIIAAALSPAADALSVSARRAVLIDADTGEVIIEKSAEERSLIASTTKIMTLITALESKPLNGTVTVRREHMAEGSSMYLREGEEITLDELYYGLMLMSGNDAALAIAEGVSGGQDKFVFAMNEKARDIGLLNTHFDNPNGLDSATHYSTAIDMARLTAYALKNPDFRKIVKTRNYTGTDRYMHNHNKLLSLYKYAIGVKTGFTKKSGRCLVGAAEKNGRTLVAVTLDASDDWNDHIKMFDYGFSRFSQYTVCEADFISANVHIVSGTSTSAEVKTAASLNLWLTEEEKTELRSVLLLPRFAYAPVREGEAAGCILFTVNGGALGTVPLVYTQSVSEQSVEEKKKGFWEWLSSLFGT